ncbi:hypothetical protein MHTCC0001_04370 [Flavobacteriaceae bacterium MHTCC 0001]
MKLIHRIGYYLGGFSIGLVVLTFFLSGKKTSCAYGPEARVLKNINSKTIVYSTNFKEELLKHSIDTSSINQMLKDGDINFSESKPRQEPCGIYHIEGSLNEKDLLLLVENCDSIATLKSLSFK